MRSGYTYHGGYTYRAGCTYPACGDFIFFALRLESRADREI
jgi:hypothetical protein